MRHPARRPHGLRGARRPCLQAARPVAHRLERGEGRRTSTPLAGTDGGLGCPCVGSPPHRHPVTAPTGETAPTSAKLLVLRFSAGCRPGRPVPSCPSSSPQQVRSRCKGLVSVDLPVAVPGETGNAPRHQRPQVARHAVVDEDCHGTGSCHTRTRGETPSCFSSSRLACSQRRRGTRSPGNSGWRVTAVCSRPAATTDAGRDDSGPDRPGAILDGGTPSRTSIP